LPEALGELGAPALLLFAAASVAPAWSNVVRELAGASSSHGHGRAVLGAGYAGLLVHHVGDGLGLGAYSELPGGPLAHADVLAALAVHTVPLVAVVTLAFRAQRGARAAVERALGLAVASVGGVMLSGSVPAAFTQSLSAWIAAGVAGLLLHVVTHDLGRDLPATPVARLSDWAAAGLGFVTSTLGADTDLQTLRASLLHALTTGALQGALAIALSLAAALFLARSSARSRQRVLEERGVAARFAALPQPAAALDGAVLAANFANLPFGIFFGLGTALTTSLTSLLPRHRLEPPPSHPHRSLPPTHPASPSHANSHHADSHHADSHHADSHPHAGAHHVDAHSGADSHSHSHSDDATHPLSSPVSGDARATFATATALLREPIAWAMTGLVLYALLSASLGADALARLRLPLALAGAVVCGLPLALPPITAVFIAAAVWQHGLRFEAALAFAVIASLRAPKRVAELLLTVVAGVGVGCVAGLFDTAQHLAPLTVPLPLGAVALVLVLAATAAAAWAYGIRGLFAGVFHSHDSA
jgi:hypothetical protein